MRESLSCLIGGTPGYRCTGAFRSMEDALQQSWAEVPDVVLLDIGLPGMSGIEGLTPLRARCPKTPIVILSVYDDDDRIFEALCNGACGYLLKKTAPTELLKSLRDVVDGGAPMSPEVARKVTTLFSRFRPPSRASHDLTPHEARVLRLLVQGHSYKTAAVELGVSFHAVAFHVKHIYEKLHVHSKSEAVVKALRDRLIY
jgi:DNA-binding NarL/FixJ family response regulator